MSARTLAAGDYTGLKAATGLFLTRGFGGQMHAAPHTRVSQQTLSDYASRAPQKADSFMPVDVLADLVSASGDTTLLRQLASMADCLLVPLPPGDAGGVVAERTGRSAKEFGDVMVRIGEALRDGRISEAEAAGILKEIREVMLELSALGEAVKAAVVAEDA